MSDPEKWTATQQQTPSGMPISDTYNVWDFTGPSAKCIAFGIRASSSDEAISAAHSETLREKGEGYGE